MARKRIDNKYFSGGLFDFFEEDLTLDDKNKGIKDEKNGHISELGLFKGDTQQYSLSPTIQSMDEQGYEISRVRNISDTSKMDSNVSSNNENVGYIRNSDSSTAASTSRVGNFGNNSSRHNEIERDDRYGNTRDQHVNSTRSLFESGSGTIVTEVLGSDGERQKNERRIRGGRKSDKSILQNNSIAGQFQESSSTSNTGTWGARANEGERGSMGSEIRRDIRRTGERNRQEKHSGSIDKDSQAITKIDYKANLEVDFGNLKERFKKNIRAIQCLKSIEAENRFATRTEQAILNEFSGWGGLPQAFNPENTEWELEYQELKLTLTNDEYQRARNSTQDAFYTPKTIIDTIYKALDHLGFNDDNTKDIFEPSAGIGSFLTYAPENQNYHFTGVELDNISSRILKQLHQKQDIRKAGSFENVIFNRQYDAFIGNPPFGQKKILDVNDLNLNKLSVHNYFVGNSIKNLKNNGIAAFVISSYYLDSKNSSIRELIGNDATFLGAVRLPNNAFKKRANTEVTTDIIFYQKGFNQKYNKSCIKSQMYFKNNIEMMAKKLNLDEDTIKSFHINEYFIDHPENILGNLEVKSTQYGHSLECVDSGKNIEIELTNFISRLPKNIYSYEQTVYKDSYFIINKDSDEYINYADKISNLKTNNYFMYNDEIFLVSRIENDEIMLKKPSNLSDNDKIKIIKMIDIRDQFNELIKLEKITDSENSQELTKAREKLNLLYDNFVKTEGFLNRSVNKKAFKEDVEANKILALEKNYSDGISKKVAMREGVEPMLPSAQKADIFAKRTIFPTKQLKITTPQEALLASLSNFGKVNLAFIKNSLPNISLEEVLKDLTDKKLIFIDHHDKFNYILAEKYLSGNVKQKYKEVKYLVDNGQEHLRANLESLKEILPKDLKAVDISLGIGTSWIPIEYYKQFISEILQINKSHYDLIHHNETGTWKISGNSYGVPLATVTKYATTRIGIFDVIDNALKRSPITIYDKIETQDGKEKRVLNSKETAIANSKLEQLKNDFNDWIYKDFDRRTALERIYNDQFNTNVEPKYDGSHLNLEGFNSNIQLKVHQKNAIWRSIQESKIIFDHQVGAGKTLVAICSLMEQKRMGLINKPLIVVPNHLAKQWNNEFYNAYPNANILTPSEDDLKKDNREQFFSKIATNEYDAIIMTHSQFKLIPVPYEIEKQLLEEEIRLLREVKSIKESKDNVKYYSVKQDEKLIDSAKTKLNTLLSNHKKSKSIDFSELGIDALAIDEAHEFKNLKIATAMGNISGLGNINGSQKAMDLYCKTKYIHENNSKLFFLTGTPISNSIAELYTIQRYMQPDILKEKGISSFDAWASTFGEVSSSWELDSSGINYKIISRFNKFKNVPELSAMYKNVADIVTNTDIMKFQKNFVPKLHNDKPINVISPRSKEIANFIGVQDENKMWNEGSIIWRMENQDKDITRNNLLACTTDARKAGLDFRLIDPHSDDYANSKINELVKNVFNTWNEWSEDKGTQLIFCDLSTPKKHSQKIDTTGVIKIAETQEQEKDFTNINDSIENSLEDEPITKSMDELLAANAKFDVYTDILKKLVNLGIPQNEIRFIHDAKTDLQKAQLFSDMNTGKARILIGSTQKMGAGTNVQKKIVALHHLDCPWRPSDLEQRTGRAIRQGNELFIKDPENFRIKEFRYATERTYDARMWQVIESKALSIEQFRKAGADVRTLDDISSGAADAAEMKAEATGNPFILMQVQLSSDLRQEELLYNGYQREIYNNEESLKHLEKNIAYMEKELLNLQQIQNIIHNNPIKNFSGQYYNYNIITKEASKHSFNILKDDNSDENKAIQNEVKRVFEKNINSIAHNYKNELNVFEYRGLRISGNMEDLNTMVFSISDPSNDNVFIQPTNLTYNKNPKEIFPIESLISFTGFVSRLNNFCSDIDKNIEKHKNELESAKKDFYDLKIITGKNTPEYKRKAYLEALRSDNIQIINEIEEMTNNKNYQSSFTPKSYQVLRSMEKAKKEIDFER